jgi:hypothetical protein
VSHHNTFQTKHKISPKMHSQIEPSNLQVATLELHQFFDSKHEPTFIYLSSRVQFFLLLLLLIIHT